MIVFYDTSAIVPLILIEPNSDKAQRYWKKAEGRIAWRWLKVEVEAALTRRKAPSQAWNNWDRIEMSLEWVELPDSLTESLCRFNRTLGLRAADAGHLFIMERLTREFEDMELATFDKEMRAAARELGIAVL
jgi:predicted nucleic acid-binding protein